STASILTVGINHRVTTTLLTRGNSCLPQFRPSGPSDTSRPDTFDRRDNDGHLLEIEPSAAPTSIWLTAQSACKGFPGIYFQKWHTVFDLEFPEKFATRRTKANAATPHE